MNRYVDVELLLEDMTVELEKAKEENLTEDELKTILTSAIALKDFVNRQSTADVVEVVRCKDCESYNGHRWCYYFAQETGDNDFCSYGKKVE